MWIKESRKENGVIGKIIMSSFKISASLLKSKYHNQMKAL